jgi:hypothetical protein
MRMGGGVVATVSDEAPSESTRPGWSAGPRPSFQLSQDSQPKGEAVVRPPGSSEPARDGSSRPELARDQPRGASSRLGRSGPVRPAGLPPACAAALDCYSRSSARHL